MKTITIANQKGGCGKTATAAALSAGLLRRGYSVLAVDCDPQHSLTMICAAQALPCTLSDVILGTKRPADAIRPTAQGFDILPGDLSLAELPKGYRLDTLRRILSEVNSNYAYCVIDTPPSLSVMTMSALVAASVAVIPTMPDVLSLYGLDQAAETIEAVRPYNDALSVGVLLTQYNPRRNMDKTMQEVIAQRAQEMGATVYRQTIRAGVAVPESHLTRQSLFTSAPRAGVTQDYSAFIDEFLKGVNNG